MYCPTNKSVLEIILMENRQRIAALYDHYENSAIMWKWSPATRQPSPLLFKQVQIGMKLSKTSLECHSTAKIMKCDVQTTYRIVLLYINQRNFKIMEPAQLRWVGNEELLLVGKSMLICKP